MFHQYLSGILFYLVFTLCAAIGLPWTRRVFGDRLLAWWTAKIFGLLAYGYVVWLLATLHILPSNNVALLTALFLAAVGAGVYFSRPPIPLLGRAASFEALSIAVYLCYLLLRSFNPNFNTGEKFMDVAMLMSAGKTDYFPFADPWYASLPVNYYYYGYHLLSLLTKLSHAPYQVAYNYAIALVYVTSATGVAALVMQLTRSRLMAVIGAFWVTTAGTVQYGLRVLASFFSDGAAPYYATVARPADISYIINEFPSYVFTVCDLHPHITGLPFLIANLILLWRLAGAAWPDWWLLGLFVLGWASDALVNSWDAITVGAIFGLILLGKLGWRRALVWTSATAGAVLALCLPFLIYFQSPVGGIGIAPLYAAQHDLFGEKAFYPTPLLWWIGMWAPFLIAPLAGFWRARRRQPAPQPQAVKKGKKAPPPPPEAPRPVVLTTQFTKVLWIVGIGLLLFVELFFLKDLYSVTSPPFFRANTVYKFGIHCWVILTIAMAADAVRMLGRKPARIYWGALAALGALYPWQAMTQFYDITGVRSVDRALTLDGLAFLSTAPPDAGAIEWLNRTQTRRRVVLEAVGNDYGYHGRISSFTGMANPINWQSHEFGWRYKPSEATESRILAISQDVARIYQTPNIEETRALLRQYGVSFVWIGEMERSVYSGLNEAKFQRLGSVVFSSDRSKLFQVD
jgi:uncharacterized membrane protein